MNLRISILSKALLAMLVTGVCGQAAVIELGKWRMGDADDSVAVDASIGATVDSSGNGLELGRLGSVTYSSIRPAAGGSYSAYFTGTSSLLGGPAPVVNAASQSNVGAEAWFRLNGDQQDNAIIVYTGNTGGRGHGLFVLDGGADLFAVLIGGQHILTFGPTISPNVWYYAAYVFQGTSLTAYLAAEGEAALSSYYLGEFTPGQVDEEDDSIFIGGNPNQPTETLDGWIDEVRMFRFNSPGDFSTADLSFVPIPEPSSAALLVGMTMLGLAAGRRRRRDAA